MAQLQHPSERGLSIISEYLQGLKFGVFEEPLFRGQASCTWNVIASAHRDDAAGIDDDEKLAEWKRIARRFIPSGFHSDLQYLVLAQHYGIPTFMIDWTKNPLVALYFASNKYENGQDGVVFKVNGSPENFEIIIEDYASHNLFNEDQKKPFLVDATAMNPRSAAQDGYLTLSANKNVDLNLKEVFRISGRDKNSVIIALRKFGISPDRIFADLNSAADNFKDELYNRYIFEEFIG